MEDKKIFRAGDVFDGEGEVEVDTFSPGDYVDVYGLDGKKYQHGIVTQVLAGGGVLLVEFDDTNPIMARKSPRTDTVAAGMCKKVAE